MNQEMAKLMVLLGLVLLSSGCSTHRVSNDASTMISAAEFDEMISVEVKELEALPVDSAIAANRN